MKKATGSNLMLKVGSVVTTTVDQVETYGVFLSSEGKRVFIQIPEIDWVIKIPDPRAFTAVGDTQEALILTYNETKDLYYGSIKRATPELDPYRAGLLFQVGTKHQCKVLSNTDFGTFVEIVPGLEALIYNKAGGHFTIGEILEVSVVLYDIQRRSMEVEVCS